MLRVDVSDRLRRNENISGTTVRIGGHPIGDAFFIRALSALTLGFFPGLVPTAPLVTAVTNRAGRVDLDLSAVPNGDHLMVIQPAEFSMSPVGPATANVPVPPNRIHRPIEATVTITAGIVMRVVPIPNRSWGSTIDRVSGSRIRVRLQPVWMLSPNQRPRPGAANPTIVVVHHTGGRAIGPALNQFLGAGGTSSHYIIDTDGHIIKMVKESERAAHAGTARWAGITDVNTHSIGIEIVHRDGDFPNEQYDALIGLMDRITTAVPSIMTERIVGHSDVGTNAAGRHGRKSTDPGNTFEWSRLEARGWGLLPDGGPQPTNIYGGFFDLVPGGSFRLGDNDARQVYGGRHRPGVAGTPITDLQNDLASIGYSIDVVDGRFDAFLFWAAQMLQQHFTADGRVPRENGRVDLQTATLIRQVL